MVARASAIGSLGQHHGLEIQVRFSNKLIAFTIASCAIPCVLHRPLQGTHRAAIHACLQARILFLAILATFTLRKVPCRMAFWMTMLNQVSTWLGQEV